MTEIGKTILTAYSLLVVIILMALSIRKMEKENGKGLQAVFLVPVFIFLLNSM